MGPGAAASSSRISAARNETARARRAGLPRQSPARECRTRRRGRRLDVERRTITVERSRTEQPGGGFHFGRPKSAAGRRKVSFPELITDDLRKHLDSSTGPAEHDLVFTSPTGTPLRHGNFRRRVWLPALTRAKLPGIRFHDLRHTGNTMTAHAGANLRELMERRATAPPGPR